MNRDQQARTRARDGLRSLSLSAPAGSGKTELLTQRVLRLLAEVEQPEAILAITFTRKATGEMRTRILEALQQARAATDSSLAQMEEHKRTTLELARAALQQNDRLQWSLLDNPNRLQILTFDGLCRRLAGSLPLESGVSLPPEISQSPQLLYRDAAVRTLDHLESSHPVALELELLIDHLGIDEGQVINQVAELLPSRQSWLALITGDNLSRTWLQESLEQLVNEKIANMHAELGAMAGELADLVDFALEQGGSDLEKNLQAGLLRRANSSLEDLDAWRALANFLLTKAGQVRSKVDARQGFPPKCPEKSAMQAVLAEMRERGSLVRNLDELRKLPDPQISDEEWRLVRALASVLQVAAAELRLLQQELGICDYPEVSMAALRALGESDQPTPLAERLDYRIQHILVDEFQDTSGAQIELLERLTAGWQQDDGRTLFVVGDAMQSIYEFRQARVELFLRTCREGVGEIKPEPLALSSNFRSRPLLVDRVNSIFLQSLGRLQSQNQGFSAATAARDAHPEAGVHCAGHLQDEEEARAVADHIRRLVDRGETDIALLVRGRNHLTHILPALREKNIPWRAQDIDPLASRMAIQDIDSLRRALCSPADRIAWLALLRAPWAGLDQADLLALVETARTREICLAEAIRNADCQAVLSDPGRAILHRLSEVLGRAQDRLGQQPLARIVDRCWRDLDGPATLYTESDQSNVRDYLALLEEQSEGDSYPEAEAFELALGRLYARPRGDADAALQIMTIHKSKGLEFDHVIVPALAKSSGSGSNPLLIWNEVEFDSGQRHFLMSPKAKRKADNALYDYLLENEKERRRQEQMRLLYVAMTRAKESLYLSAVLKQNSKGETLPPTGQSLLAAVWDSLEADFCVASQSSGPTEDSAVSVLQGLRRLDPQRPLRAPIPVSARAIEPGSADFKSRYLSRALGDILHADLCLLTGRLETALLDDCRRSWNRRLAAYGLTDEQIPSAKEALERALERVKSSSTAKWLLAAHKHQGAELAMARLDDSGSVQHLVLDRTFVEAGHRWIVDYKTAEPLEGENEADFIAAQINKYRGQLAGYQSLFNDYPVRTALYFPLLDRLEEFSSSEDPVTRT